MWNIDNDPQPSTGARTQGGWGQGEYRISSTVTKEQQKFASRPQELPFKTMSLNNPTSFSIQF